MTRTLFAREFGIKIEDHLEEILFIGDSPNDEPMFKFLIFRLVSRIFNPSSTGSPISQNS